MNNTIKTCVCLFAFVTTHSHAGSCSTWFQNNGPKMTGTDIGIVWNKDNSNWSKLFSIGRAVYDFDDSEEVSDAAMEAKLIAKSNFVKFMSERVTSDESVSSLSKKHKEAKKENNTSTVKVTKKTIKTITRKISSKSSELLKGVLTFCESVDNKKKEVEVIVGVSRKTMSMSDSFRYNIKKNQAPEENTSLNNNGSSKNKAGSRIRHSNNLDF